MFNEIGNENNIFTNLPNSPLNPLKGRIASNLSRNMLATITPLRGPGGEEMRQAIISIT
jgi:hypothetical protein